MIWVKDQYATVWEIEKHGKYSVVRLGTSRKDKATGNYANSSWPFVTFLGKANDAIDDLEVKDRILIKTMSLDNEPYEKDGEKKYPKNTRFKVFEFEKVESKHGDDIDSPPAVASDEDMPF